MTDTQPPTDVEQVQYALRRLNPEFYEHDISWPSLERIVSKLTKAEQERDEAETKGYTLLLFASHLRREHGWGVRRVARELGVTEKWVRDHGLGPKL